ncbi:hypothetical protein [Pelagibius sp.]|uniref:hypothetical protein n=1 Tax=Pelagibius sp. TaxID=1931238 RepID=UPI0026139279|nr:hypothetical protein [Pelagibius sp.]
MLVLKPYAKAAIFQGYLSSFFYALFAGVGAWMATQFELWSVGFFIAAGAGLAGVIQFFRGLRKWRQEAADLRETTYVFRNGELAVVNERSGVELVYRPSEVAEIEAFKVPFGYQLKLYRIGESKEHSFRIFGVRVFAGEHMQIPEESGLLTLRGKEDADEIISHFQSA